MKDMLEKAKSLAQKHHGNAVRKSGDPYVQHPLNVLALLQSHRLPEQLLVAGVLHDIIEDTPLTQEDLRKDFGERIAFLVSAVSKNQKPEQPEIYINPLEGSPLINQEFYQKLSDIEEENFRFLGYVNKFFYSVIADPWVAFIKIADQIDNMRDVEVFSKKKAKRKIEEVHFYFWPIYERITEKEVMSHELIEPYEAIKAQLWEILENKKKQLKIELGPVPKRKSLRGVS